MNKNTPGKKAGPCPRAIRRLTFALVCTGILLTSGQAARAIPTLQLDIGGGTYVNGGEQSTVANQDQFNLYALLFPGKDKNTALNSLYRVSAALYPKTAETQPSPSLGTFSFDGETIRVAEDIHWGIPPYDLLEGTTVVGSTLQPHGIFNTYFVEFDVEFDANFQLAPYNVQDNPGDPTTFNGTGMYYQGFEVDVSGLADGYGIHFDLYEVDKTLNKSSGSGKRARSISVFSTDMVEKAPYSHDGSTAVKRFRVPDQSTTFSLLGLGLVGLAALRRFLATA